MLKTDETLRPRQRLVGLSGWARSGKDEAAKALVQAGWTRFAFADPLRRCALAVNPYVPTDIYGDERFVRLADLVEQLGWEEAKKNPEVRRILIDLGTPGVRDCISDRGCIWAMETQIAGVETPIVVTDCRFPNEASWVRFRGGIVVKLEREGTQALGVADRAVNEIKPDFTILNCGSIETLHAAILSIVNNN